MDLREAHAAAGYSSELETPVPKADQLGIRDLMHGRSRAHRANSAKVGLSTSASVDSHQVPCSQCGHLPCPPRLTCPSAQIPDKSLFNEEQDRSERIRYLRTTGLGESSHALHPPKSPSANPNPLSPSHKAMDAREEHIRRVNDSLLYYGGSLRDYQPPERLRNDFDNIEEHHRFLWDDDDDGAGGDADSHLTWEERQAKKFDSKLYQEYAVADLSRYKSGQVGLRWRTEPEVLAGKGEFVCGSLPCPDRTALRSFEVNFAYREHGVAKQALVKLRLCPSCAARLVGSLGVVFLPLSSPILTHPHPPKPPSLNYKSAHRQVADRHDHDRSSSARSEPGKKKKKSKDKKDKKDKTDKQDKKKKHKHHHHRHHHHHSDEDADAPAARASDAVSQGGSPSPPLKRSRR